MDKHEFIRVSIEVDRDIHNAIKKIAESEGISISILYQQSAELFLTQLNNMVAEE